MSQPRIGLEPVGPQGLHLGGRGRERSFEQANLLSRRLTHLSTSAGPQTRPSAEWVGRRGFVDAPSGVPSGTP